MTYHPEAAIGPGGETDEITTLARAARKRIANLRENQLLLSMAPPPPEWFERLSGLLAGLDPDPTRPLGVLLEGSPREPYLVLAVLASGRGAILLNGRLPREACLGALEEVSACGVLADGPGARELPDVMLADELEGDGVPPWDPEPEQHALFTMTSGTTGSRKLFARSHQALVQAAHARIRGFGLRPEERVLSFTPLHFTGGMNQLATAIVGTHRLELGRLTDCTGPGASAYLESFRPTVINSPPSVMRNLLRATATEGLPASLDTYSTSGELVLAEDVRRFHEQAPAGAQLMTSYGSTESGTVLIGVLDPSLAEHEGHLPLGEPLPGVEVLVVDDELRPVDDERPGRVLVRSSHRSTSDAEGRVSPLLKVVEGHGEDPWLDMGDRGWITEDGRLVIAGRVDGELLYGGLRFHPSAIEAALGAVTGVKGVVVDLVEGREGRELLVAALDTESSKVVAQVRGALAEMGSVEQGVLVVAVGSFPLSEVGKADRRAVMERAREILERISSQKAGERTTYSRLELLIAEVWQDMLEVERPTVDAVWELLGGDSLQLLILALELEERFGLKLPTERLHGLRTVAQQAAFLEGGEDEVRVDPVVHLAGEEGAGELVVILAGVGGHAWTFQLLARELEERAQVVGLTWATAEDVRDQGAHLDEVAERICTLAGSRRVLPVGFSAGARVAWDLTARWLGMGVRVERAVLLDGKPERPRSSMGKRLRHRLRWARTRRRPLERYLEQIERSGRRALEATRVEPLDVLAVEICSRGRQTLGWERFARRVEVVRVDREHLDLLKPPVPDEVGACLRRLMDE